MQECKGIRQISCTSCSKYWERGPLVAEIFCVDENTIYEWARRWREKKDLSDEPESGRPSAFNEEERKELKDLVDKSNPQDRGINAAFWDCNGLRNYYLQNGKDVSKDAIRRTLLDIGAHYVKAQFQYKEANIERQRSFASMFFHDVKKLTDAIAMLFGDEMSTCTSPHKGYG